MTGKTLGDGLDGLRKVVSACQDCPCCYTPSSPDAPIAVCSANPELHLVNGHLARRPDDCPLAGEVYSWP